MKLDNITYDPETGVFRWKDTGKIAGGVNARGRRVVKIDGVTYNCARLAWYLSHGKWPTHEIDHINRKTLDNRLCNLQDVPHPKNLINQSRRKAYGEKHIYPSGNRWKVVIVRDYKQNYLGCFSSYKEAIKVRDNYLEVRNELHTRG